MRCGCFACSLTVGFTPSPHTFVVACAAVRVGGFLVMTFGTFRDFGRFAAGLSVLFDATGVGVGGGCTISDNKMDALS